MIAAGGARKAEAGITGAFSFQPDKRVCCSATFPGLAGPKPPAVWCSPAGEFQFFATNQPALVRRTETHQRKAYFKRVNCGPARRHVKTQPTACFAGAGLRSDCRVKRRLDSSSTAADTASQKRRRIVGRGVNRARRGPSPEQGRTPPGGSVTFPRVARPAMFLAEAPAKVK